VLIRLQILHKRFYKWFAPAMVHSVVIFASVKGFAVIEQKLTVNVLNAQNLGWGWTSLKVQEEGDVRAESERQRFYNRENHEEKALSNSKII